MSQCFCSSFSNHGEHQGHGVVDAFDAAAGAGVVGACGEIVDAEALIEGARESRADLNTVIGKESNGASPKGDVAIDEDIDRTGCGELSLGSGVHISAVADTVGEKEDVGVAPRCDG